MTCQDLFVQRDSQFGSFRETRCIAIDGDDGDGPGGVGQEDGLIMRGRQHVYRVQGDGESLDREKLDGRENGAGRDVKRGSCRRVCNQ